jgi:hypothetical protein
MCGQDIVYDGLDSRPCPRVESLDPRLRDIEAFERGYGVAGSSGHIFNASEKYNHTAHQELNLEQDRARKGPPLC